MTTVSDSFARTTICALAALGFASFTLTTAVKSVQAAPAPGWTQSVNAQISAAMAQTSITPGNGIIHVKLNVAPNGDVLGADIIGAASAAQRRAALAVTHRLAHLPATGMAQPVKISMMLQFVSTAADVKHYAAAPVQFAGIRR
jgi:hypothetical protein